MRRVSSHGAAKHLVQVEFRSNAIEGLRDLEKRVLPLVLRSGAYAGIRVFYDEMRLRVPVDEGTLYQAIYHWHDDRRSGPFQQVYAAGPNKRKAPHWYVVEFGHWLYNRRGPDGKWLRSKSDSGSRGPGAHNLAGALATPVWVPAQPYVRPTWEAMKGVALGAMRVRMRERFSEVVKS